MWLSGILANTIERELLFPLLTAYRTYTFPRVYLLLFLWVVLFERAARPIFQAYRERRERREEESPRTMRSGIHGEGVASRSDKSSFLQKFYLQKSNDSRCAATRNSQRLSSPTPSVFSLSSERYTEPLPRLTSSLASALRFCLFSFLFAELLPPLAGRYTRDCSSAVSLGFSALPLRASLASYVRPPLQTLGAHTLYRLNIHGRIPARVFFYLFSPLAAFFLLFWELTRAGCTCCAALRTKERENAKLWSSFALDVSRVQPSSPCCTTSSRCV